MKKSLSVLILVLVALTAFSFVIVDDMGRMVNIESVPERVLVAAPAITEFLVILECSDKIVGLTDWDPYAATSGIETIGNLTPLNLEKIVSLEPDIVFLSAGFQAPEVVKLDEIGITAFVVNPNSFNEISQSIVNVSIIMDKFEKGKEIKEKFESDVLKIAKNTSTLPMDEKKTVFYGMFSNDMSQIWTSGTGSFLNEALIYAGGVNVTAPYSGNNGWFPVGPEFIYVNDPDIIFVPYYYEGGQQEAINTVMNYGAFKDLKAIKNESVVPVPNYLTDYANPNYANLVKYFNENIYK